MKLVLNRPLAFLDLETTGVNTLSDRIVEIAIVKLMPDGSIDKKEWRVNPEMPIPAEASAVHGIYDKDVADCPPFRLLSNEIRQYLDNCDLAGFNSNRFDIPMLNEEFLRIGHQVDFKSRKMVDVQAIFHKMEQRNLSAAYKFYCQKELLNAHSAMADTEATLEILLSQLDKYSNLATDVDGFHEFTKGRDLLDYAGRLVNVEGVAYFNFGKFKGKTVEEVLKKEPQYYDWIMKSDFHKDTKAVLTEIFTKISLK